MKYQIKIEGLLDKKWNEWFEGMEIFHQNGHTILSGSIRDHACMYGILNMIRDFESGYAKYH